ncbi:MAG: NAD-dependent epimerase/dehydratase family protein, partial [Planctomycetaceae bacterium]|nr:NAD-dependent epimerase/dehydratase family protein [Planctomycetaceae bacterium]
MPVWLITGATGFLGRHVLAALGEWRTSGVEVVTLGRRCPPQGTFHTFLKADLDDPASVHRAIGVAAPAVVLHLAGQTPPASPEQFYRVNTLATVHLLDALRARG